MNDLIKIETREISGATIQTVNARDLHAFLESKQDFSTWIKSRIEQYGFVEGQDFTVHKFVDGRATVIDYFPSLDMAKEISMVERNEKGKQARQYFIACERRAKEPVAPQMLIPQTLPEALRLAADLADQRNIAQAALAIAAPKLEVYDLVCESDETLNMTEAAKVLQMQRDKLKNKLVEHKWFYKRPGSKNWLGHADKVQQGLIVHKLTPYIDEKTGDQKMNEQPRITGKGLVKLAMLLGVVTSGNLFGA